MITPRLATNEDKERIQEFCNEHSFKFPESNSLYICESDGEIKALGGLEIVVKVEPFISDSPAAGRRLYDYIIDTAVKNDVKKLECFVPDYKLPKVKNLYNKLGFNLVEKTNRFIKLLF